jgi:hypothetical protein
MSKINIMKNILRIKLRLRLLLYLLPAICVGQAIKSYKQAADGINVFMADGTLGIYSLSDDAVRIKFFNGRGYGHNNEIR